MKGSAMLTINEERFLSDLHDLAQIGATPAGGVHRPALTEQDLAARAWYQRKIAAAGLGYAMDGAGNQSAILLSDPPSEKRILAGSHLDSVPNGGSYDGALGLLVAFEALRTLKDHGIAPPISLEAVNFTDEESAIMGLLGSRALTGQLSPADFERCKLDADELTQRLSAAGLTRDTMLSAARGDVLAWVGAAYRAGHAARKQRGRYRRRKRHRRHPLAASRLLRRGSSRWHDADAPAPGRALGRRAIHLARPPACAGQT